MAGAASVIVSNPLDVAKVRIQTSSKPLSFFNILFGVIRTEGLPRPLPPGSLLLTIFCRLLRNDERDRPEDVYGRSWQCSDLRLLRARKKALPQGLRIIKRIPTAL